MSDREPDQFRRADDVRAEQLRVGQHVIDEGRGMNDQVHALGKPLPIGVAQAEFSFAEVAGQDFEVLARKLREVTFQFRITAVERVGDALSRRCRILATRDTDDLSARPSPSVRAIRGRESARDNRSRR